MRWPWGSRTHVDEPPRVEVIEQRVYPAVQELRTLTIDLRREVEALQAQQSGSGRA